MDSGWTFCPMEVSLLLRRQSDREVGRALADSRRATHRPGAIPLERRPLVGVDRGDLQLVADQLVVVLRVGDCRLQELQPRLGGAARREGQDSPRLLDVLPADVVAHQARLAGGRADVAGLGGDEHGGLVRRALGARPVALARGLRGRLGLGLRRGLLLRGGLLRRLLLVGGVVLGLGVVGLLLGVGLRRGLLLRRRLLLGGRLGRLLLGLGHGLAGLLGSLRLDLGGRRRLFVLLLARSRTHRTPPLPAWPRYRRVGANSPSLWPTIDSDTNTGTCLRPSCTAMVWPTISGKIVEARDQVLIICFEPEVFIASMRAIRRSSTHGPFLLERLIASYPSVGRGRCTGRTACPSVACGSRASARPTASRGGGPASSSPRRRRAGGPPGSSPCRASAGARPGDACGRPFRS